MGKRAREIPGASQSSTNDTAVCPACGKDRTARVPIAKLIESHADLFQALRLSGRELLQFIDQDSQSLVRIRKVLSNADKVRKELKDAYQWADGGTAPARKRRQTGKARAKRNRSEVSSLAPESSPPDKQVRGRNSKRNRLTRPNSYRILKFPARIRLED